MENRIMELARQIQEREENLIADCREFREEFFSNSVKEMLSYINNNSDKGYKYVTKNGTQISMRHGVIYVNNVKLGLSRYNTVKSDIRNHTEEKEIDILRSHVFSLKRARHHLTIVTENAKDILEDIYIEYSNLIHKQNVELDEIASILEVDEKPIRQIKITVEYV